MQTDSTPLHDYERPTIPVLKQSVALRKACAETEYSNAVSETGVLLERPKESASPWHSQSGLDR